MTLTHMRCTDCGCKDVKAQRTYTIQHGEHRVCPTFYTDFWHGFEILSLTC